jgi:quinoprotein glucose dehydrogenase
MNGTVLRWSWRVAPLALLLIWASLPVTSQSGSQFTTKNGEWTTYGGDLANARYSPLTQITADNFGKLEMAWRFKTESLGPRPEYQFESTPLMVKGVLYSTAGTRRAVVALDAATGELLWMHSEREAERGAAAPRQLSGRGLAYWTDGREERIVYVTPGYRMIALDAKTGSPIASFGRGGVVDLKLEDDQTMDLVKGEVGLHAAPIVGGNTVIIGAAHLSGGVPRGKSNEKGYVRGYDVKTGKRLWIFHTIPRPGELGNDTWLNDSWSYTGNTGMWAQASIDEELGLAYLPIEAPTGDYFGGHRPGNNLFSESIVAVDLKTGQRRWHYQTVHHGIWDHDIPCAPILVDITVNGRPVKALAQPTKQAFLFVLDRATGKPIWPIEERPVEKGDVPTEWYAPTQPFPLDANGKVFAYDRNGFSRDDLIDFTPELRAEGEKLISRYKIGPIYTPPVVSKAEGPLGTLQLAINGGGTVWAGGSFDPETRILYVYSRRQAGSLGLVTPDPANNDMTYVQGSPLTGVRAATPMGAPPTAAGTRGSRRWRRRRRRRRGRRTHRAGPPDREAAVREHQRHQPGQRRDPLADRARRHARPRAQSPSAQGPHHPAHGPGRHHRDACHQDAAHRGRAASDRGRGPRARRTASRVRQGDWQRRRLGALARSAIGIPDDLSAERQAVPHRGRRGRELPGRASRLPRPGVGGATWGLRE